MTSAKVFILTLSLCLCILSDSYSAEKVVQETKGDQSPAVNVGPGGSATINYYNYYAYENIDLIMAESNKRFSDCIAMLTGFQKEKLEELNVSLANLLVRNEGITEKEAQKWARDIIENAPIFKNEIENNRKILKEYNEAFSKNLIGMIYKAFYFVFETIDSRLLALKELDANSTFTRTDKFVLFSDEITKTEPFIVRSFTFNNASHIDIILKPGRIEKGLVKLCPSLIFTDFTENTVKQTFQIEPQYGRGTMTMGDDGVKLRKEEVPVKNLTYDATGQEILTDQFKEKFNEIFSAFMKIALM